MLKRIKIRHNKNLFFIIVILIILLVALIIIIPKIIDKKFVDNTEKIKECQKDSDCVPAICCHSSSCVSVENAPDCSNIFCTMVCEPESMDCGQGSCKCINSNCEAVLEEIN